MEFKNHNICTDHTDNCHMHKDSNYSYGHSEIETVLIYRHNDFYITTYCSCLRGFIDKYDFICNMLKPIDTNKHKYIYYEATKSWPTDRDLRRDIRENNLMNRKLKEINYIYRNAAGTKYSILSEIMFIDGYVNNIEVIKENYNKTLAYIKLNDLSLEDSLNDLYYYNNPFIGQVTYKTISELNKFFRKQIRNKKKTL